MLLYTLAGEEATGRLARATGIADELGFVPVRLCTPLDEGSLSRSWASMASMRLCEPGPIELMSVDDDRCVFADAVGLERALAAGEPLGREAVRRVLAAPVSECACVLLPARFEATMRTCMCAGRLAAGDLDDYATDESVRRAVRTAVAGMAARAGGTPLPADLMLTGVAPFVWSQATRTDLSCDILSVGASDLLATEGMARAMDLIAVARDEGITHASLVAIRLSVRDGLDELAHALAERRAASSLASVGDPCFCGSGMTYAECCGTKGLDGIARDW